MLLVTLQKVPPFAFLRTQIGMRDSGTVMFLRFGSRIMGIGMLDSGTAMFLRFGSLRITGRGMMGIAVLRYHVLTWLVDSSSAGAFLNPFLSFFNPHLGLNFLS
jgi:hypothetical protein